MADLQRLAIAGLAVTCSALVGCSDSPRARDAGSGDGATLSDRADFPDAFREGEEASLDATAEMDGGGDSGTLVDAEALADRDVADASMCSGEYLPRPESIDITGWTNFADVIEVGEDLAWIHRAADSSFRIVRTTAGFAGIDTSVVVRDVPSEVDGVPIDPGDGLAGPYLTMTDDWLLFLTSPNGAVFGRVYGTDGVAKSDATLLWPALDPATQRVFGTAARSTGFSLLVVEKNTDGDCVSRVSMMRVSRLGEPGPVEGPFLLAADVFAAYASGDAWILAGFDGCREEALASWIVEPDSTPATAVSLPSSAGTQTFLRLLSGERWAELSERRTDTGDSEVSLTLLEARTGETVLPPTPVAFLHGRIGDWGTLEAGPGDELAWVFSQLVGRGVELDATEQRFIRIRSGRVVQDTILERTGTLNLTTATSLLRWRDGYYLAQWGFDSYRLGALTCGPVAP